MIYMKLPPLQLLTLFIFIKVVPMMKSQDFVISWLLQTLLCSALTIPSSSPTLNQLTPISEHPQVSVNQTLEAPRLPSSLVCEKGPPWNLMKLNEEDCRILIKRLESEKQEYKFPQPHDFTAFHYRTCVVKVQSGAGRAPFPETRASVGTIADDIFHKCGWLRCGGTRVDFRSGWDVSLYSPRWAADVAAA